MVLRTIQILVAFLVVAGATLAGLWVLGVVDAAEAQASLLRLGGLFAICAVAAVFLAALFSVRRGGGG